MRRSFISVTWTPGVSEEDAQTLIRTLEDVYSLLRRQLGRPGQFDPLPNVQVFGAWTLPDIPADAAYANVEWYVSRCTDDNRERILASRYLEAVYLEPWQGTHPHFDLAVTDLPIVGDLSEDDPSPEVLGVNRPGLLSLISSNPFASIDNPDLRSLAMRHTFAHYFGLLFAVPLTARTDNVTEHLGNLYCTATCAMRFTDTPTLALSFGRQQMAGGVIYCDACQRDLISQITGYYYGLN